VLIPSLSRLKVLGVPRLTALLEERCERVGMDLVTTALTISRIPYGRPGRLTARGVLDEWIGTCSTKHMLFAAVVSESWPELRPRLWHRPYLVTRELATSRWGGQVAGAVPATGLVDVHTFATLELDHGPVSVDVTFPLPAWDGESAIPLACGPGLDHPAGDDVLASKAQLVARHCDPAVREPFIAALAAVNS
jgi:hypothetical protein